MHKAWHGAWTTGKGRWLRAVVHAPLIAEAAIALFQAKISIRRRPFADVMEAAPIGDRKGDPMPVRWAVDIVARRVPWRSVCLDRGLALHRLLRRRGHRAVLHYGIRQDKERLEAHVWVSLDGVLLSGGDQAPNFKEVRRYPA